MVAACVAYVPMFYIKFDLIFDYQAYVRHYK